MQEKLFGKPQPKNDTIKPDEPYLPSELNTERARKYFREAIKRGLLETTETGYKSNFDTKSLLVYFLELTFCRDDNNKDNGKSFPESVLNNLFNENRLGKARGQLITNKTGKPKRYKVVDDIFI